MGPRLSAGASEPYEVRARVAARTDSLEEAARIGNEVEALYTNGPAGGGGASRLAREVVGVASAFVPTGEGGHRRGAAGGLGCGFARSPTRAPETRARP